MPDEIKLLKKRIFGKTEDKEIPEELPADSEILTNDFKGQFSLEEIMEALSRQKEPGDLFVIRNNKGENAKSLEDMSRNALLVEENPSKKSLNIILYELGDQTYYIYLKKKKEEKVRELNEKIYSELKEPIKHEDKTYGLFMPTGLVVRRVSQNTLGRGVLGRAFISMNYVEILDYLMGDEFMEVLTHEVLHIMYPDKRELEIRQLTIYQLGNKTVYH